MAKATIPCNNIAVERIARARDLGYPILFHCGFGPQAPAGDPLVCSIEYGDDLVGIDALGTAHYMGSSAVAFLIEDAEAEEAWAEHAEEVERDRCASY